MLNRVDFLVLGTPLAREVMQHLPVPGSVAFCVLDTDGLSPLHCGRERVESPAPSTPAVSLEPRVRDHRLILPMPLPSGEVLAVVISEIDAALLKKMAPSWLRELRSTLLERFATLRLAYIDPETEMYNRRAATALLEDPAVDEGCFYLLGVSFQKRTAAATSLKIKEIADLLPVLTQGICFSFGYGVFGVFHCEHNREQALKTCHYVQHQLKREGMHKVQIGFSLGKSAINRQKREDRLDRLWQALAMAEKRGPFGLCDIDSAMVEACRPFPPLSGDLHRRIGIFSRDQERFFLAALLADDTIGATAIETTWIESLLAGQGVCLGQEGRHVFLLLFEADKDRVGARIEQVLREWAQHWGTSTVSVGLAAWPWLDFSKREVAVNCLKALLHGSFLGPGSVVWCDHLSLHVSGDAFFEEGDYRSAIREYRRGLQVRPDDVNLRNSLGVALVECNQPRKAAACFREVLDSEPANAMALTNLGNVLQTLGEKAAALDCYERALREFAETDASAQELLLSTGKLYTDLGRYEQAASLLERWRILSGSGGDFRGFRLLGQNYRELGRAEEAMQACQRALRLFPRDSISLSTLGLLYVEHGQGLEVGLRLCRKALELDTLNPDHWLRLSRALVHAGEATEALTAIRRCLALRYAHPDGILLLGRIYQILGKPRRAEKCFRRVVAMNDQAERQAEQARGYLASVSPATGPGAAETHL